MNKKNEKAIEGFKKSKLKKTNNWEIKFFNLNLLSKVNNLCTKF